MSTKRDMVLLYSRLRSQMLTRNWVYNKFFRTELFDTEVELGIREHDQDKYCCGDTYKTGDAFGYPLTNHSLQDYLKREGRNSTSISDQIARWQIECHHRDNPLQQSGLRIIQFAIEYYCGKEESLEIVHRTLNTIESLFKCKNINSPCKGYIVRFDAMTSDNWVTTRNLGSRNDVPLTPTGNKPSVVEKPVFCCNFPVNSNVIEFQSKPYSYTWDLEAYDFYKVAKATDGFEYKKYLRKYEPSMDELIGIIGGYSLAVEVLKLCPVSNMRDECISLMKEQADRIGKFLSHNRYNIVRANPDNPDFDWGFTARGATGINTALEFPIAVMVSGITGNPPENYYSDSSITYTDIIKRQCASGYGDIYQVLYNIDNLKRDILNHILSVIPVLRNRNDTHNLIHLMLRDSGGLFFDLFWQNIDPSDQESLLNLLDPFYPINSTLEVIKSILQFFAIVKLCKKLDLWDEEEQIAVAYTIVLTAVFPDPKARFFAWLKSPPLGCSECFKPFICFAAVGFGLRASTLTNEQTFLKNVCAEWVSNWQLIAPSEYRTKNSLTMITILRLFLDPTIIRRAGETSFSEQIFGLYYELKDKHNSNLVMDQDVRDNDITEEIDRSTNGDPAGTFLSGYMLLTTLGWLYRKHLKNPSDLPVDFPECANFQDWSSPIIPKAIVKAASDGLIQIPKPITYNTDSHFLPDTKNINILGDLLPKQSETGIMPPPPVNAVPGTTDWKVFKNMDISFTDIAYLCDLEKTKTHKFDITISEPQVSDEYKKFYRLVVQKQIDFKSSNIETIKSIDFHYENSILHIVIVLKSWIKWSLVATAGSPVPVPQYEIVQGYLRIRFVISWIPTPCTNPKLS